MKKQCAAEAAVDSLQQQMMDLCRSDTLTRAREQHDRDMAAMKEQHEARLLALQQKLDTQGQNLEEQVSSLLNRSSNESFDGILLLLLCNSNNFSSHGL